MTTSAASIRDQLRDELALLGLETYAIHLDQTQRGGTTVSITGMPIAIATHVANCLSEPHFTLLPGMGLFSERQGNVGIVLAKLGPQRVRLQDPADAHEWNAWLHGHRPALVSELDAARKRLGG